jgi:Spy/CpxP family protein refolding chaperone
VKAFKVILATLVIFAAGVVTGGFLVKKTISKPLALKSQPQPYPGEGMQDRLFERMKQDLNLTQAQVARLEKIFGDSRERLREMWGLLAPEWEAEKRETKEKVRAELNPEQQQRFEDMLKGRPHKSGERRRGPDGSNDVRRSQTQAGDDKSNR